MKQKIQLASFASVVVLLMFLVSSIFVPYKQIVFSIIQNIMPYDLKQLEVSGQSYSDYFVLKEAAVSAKDQTIVLIFKTTSKFPVTKEQLNNEWLRVSNDMEKRLVIEAIARKRFRCVLFDKDGKYYSEYTVRMVWNEDHSEFGLSFPLVKVLGKIEIGY